MREEEEKKKKKKEEFKMKIFIYALSLEFFFMDCNGRDKYLGTCTLAIDCTSARVYHSALLCSDMLCAHMYDECCRLCCAFGGKTFGPVACEAVAGWARWLAAVGWIPAYVILFF